MLLDIKLESMDADAICSALLDEYMVSYEAFLDYQDTLCGRYCIFYGDDASNIHIMQDPTGMRSAYYYEKGPVVASHYNLIRDYLPDIKPHPYYQQYLKLNPKPWLLPGNFTPWIGIKELFANHELDVSKSKMYRFWPRKEHDYISIDEVTDCVLNLLKKQVEILMDNKEIVVSLTAGNDSRLSTSLLRDYRERLLFYTYTSSSDPDKEKDCERARKIANDLGLNFLALDLDEIGEDESRFKKIKEITSHNHYHRHVPKAIPLYFDKMPQGKVHLQSNLIEIVRNFEMFEGIPIKSSAKDLVHKIYSMDENNSLVQEMFQEYFDDSEFDNVYNYLSADIIFWEYRLGEWLNGAVLVETDFVYDTYMLFNCRRILEMGLSSPRFFKRNNTIPYYVVRNCWPAAYFDIPNTNFDLFDIADSDSSRLELGSLNINVRSSVDQSAYTYLGRYSLELGYSKSKVTEYSFVSASFKVPIKPSKRVWLQVESIVPNRTFTSTGVSDFIININNQEIYCTDVGDYKGLKNVINICRDTGNCTELDVEFTICSKKEHVSYYGIPGYIVIKGVRVKYLGDSSSSGDEGFVRSDKEWKQEKLSGPFTNNAISVSILGSCVSRDLFHLDFEKKYQVTSYVQHHSPLLLLQSGVEPINIDDNDVLEFSHTPLSDSMVELLSHNFNIRMFKSLINNHGKELLLKNKGDWIILDTFYSFPSKMLMISDSNGKKYYVQDNVFYANIAKMAAINRKFDGYDVKVIDGCPNSSTLIGPLCDFLKENWGDKIIVINTRPCKQQFSMVSGFKDMVYDASEEGHSNKLYKDLVEKLGCYSIEIPDIPLSRDGYVVHYIAEVMYYIKESVDEIISKKHRDAKRRYLYNVQCVKEGSRIDSFVGRQYLNYIFDRHDEELDKKMMPVAKMMIEQNDFEGYAQLGRMQRFGRGCKKNPTEARKNLSIAVNNGIMWAAIELFDLEWYNNILSKNTLNIICDLANSNDKKAKLRLARALKNGQAVERDLYRSADLFRECYKQSNVNIACELFDVLIAIGDEECLNEAYSIMDGIIDKNDMVNARLAKCYQCGYGVKKDTKKAEMIYKSLREKAPWVQQELNKLGGINE